MTGKKQAGKWIFRLSTLLICGAAGLGYFSWTNNRPLLQALEPAVLAQEHAINMPPESLYRKAWGIIKDSYYEQKYSTQEEGQNWLRWQHRYDGKLKTQEDANKAIETMLASLGDPYTRFLDAEQFGEEKRQIQAKLFGVGMQLGMNKEHKVIVIAPITDTPAYKAGVHSGDEIIEVDGKPVKGQSLDAVVKQIRGQKGSKVSISFLRAGKKEIIAIVRDEIPIKSVETAEMLPGDIGYIRLGSFISQKANNEMRDSIKKLEKCKGLIIDLRHNPGGLLTNAIEIANMFLERGVIVSTIDNDGYKTSQLASRSSYKCEIPLVVLINKGSASASEILSGALRDNGRAKLVGETSFGKGLVQAINPLGNGAGINVTIAKYLTPNDTDINKTGIVPDVEVKVSNDDYTAGKGPWWYDPSLTNFKRSPNDGKDVQLVKAIELMKKQLSGNSPDTVASTHAPQEGTAKKE